MTGIALVMSVLVLAVAGCSFGSACDNSTGVDRDVVTFEATVSSVADDGAVELAVESVVPRDTTTRTDPTVFGVPHATTPPVLDSVAVGSSVTVQFPPEQVEHLRRDIGKRYRVEARVDDATGGLTTQLRDIHAACGPTRLADEGP